jgi:hypothetical protein
MRITGQYVSLQLTEITVVLQFGKCWNKMNWNKAYTAVPFHKPTRLTELYE